MTRIIHNGMTIQIGGSSLIIPPVSTGYQVELVITIQSDSSEGSISVNGDEKLSLVGDTNDTISTTITMQLGDTTTFYSNMDYMIIPYKDGKGMAKDFNPASLTSYDASWDKIELQIYFSQT